MRIFSKHQKKIDPRRRFGGMQFRNKIKEASNYKRAFNPTSGFSLNILSDNKGARIAKVLGIAIFLVIFYFTIISPALLINTVDIKGNVQVPTSQIEDVLDANADSRFFMIPKNNFFLMSKGRVNKVLTESIPTIKEVIQYDRHWPNRGTIEIVEHKPGFVIQTNGNYFLLDDEGVVVEQVQDPKKMFIAEDQVTESFERGETLPNQKLAPFILSMSKSWSSKISTPIVAAKFPGKSSHEVHFITTTGWVVMFDTGRSVTVQLDDLTVILSKQVGSSQMDRLAYVDLRLDKWAYYCFKETPCSSSPKPAEAGATTTNEE
jgi:cell division septal protein FtsQ